MINALNTVSNPRYLEKKDLNSVTDIGFYTATFGNGCSNCPPEEANGGSPLRGFSLLVINNAGVTGQVCFPRASPSGWGGVHIYYRRYEDWIPGWTNWTKL